MADIFHSFTILQSEKIKNAWVKLSYNYQQINNLSSESFCKDNPEKERKRFHETSRMKL